MTSAVALCVGSDGHAEYEWSEDACCGEIAHPEPVSCCEECGVEPGPGISAAPECGGCVDGLAPMASGVQVDLNPVTALPAETGAVEHLEAIAAEETFAAGGPGSLGPPLPLPLRC